MPVPNSAEPHWIYKSSSPPRYRYQRLRGPRSVRILELLPEKRGSPLQCHLREVKLDDAPNYEAVSYVWGAPDVMKQITCDTLPSDITKSCSYALHYLRLEEEARLLWIDACCINQKTEREQTQQVRIMGDIYSRAKRTLVWLGKSTGNDISTMCYISRIGRSLSRDEDQSTDSTTGLIYAKTESRQPWYRHFVDAEEKKPSVADFNSLFSKPWFLCVWTVQEFALSRHCILLCGNICGITSMKAEHLMAFLALNEEQTFLLSRIHRLHIHRKMRT
ncbi:heterokaryon incompatibility protein-domain-containing protein [Ampelomyces quisqualis]|uniref:Heterokaryon incompatibility protein-domain-containing protein n=1 Tax=Ampelomyces quisqualis TaxID=50730 RepID=A0A6A5QIW0_AMPQU|nr:heterokaryon incompatibility protein-domain-containing protein [Ampelomyces quisqualis]